MLLRYNGRAGQHISYPRSPGSSAGGTGTYDDPVTFAANKEAFPPRSIIYMPKWKKYGIMEDDCQECDKDWRDGKKRHVDVWLGPDQSTAGTTDCEDTLSMNHGDYTGVNGHAQRPSSDGSFGFTLSTDTLLLSHAQPRSF